MATHLPASALIFATARIAVGAALCALSLARLDAVGAPPGASPPALRADADPSVLWADYDPAAGDFREEVVREETKDGVFYRDSYISASVLGEEIRVWCVYAVKAGARKAPGLLNVHGWMGAASIDQEYVRDGWAVLSFDYCGQTGSRPQFTKYPSALVHCNMDRALGGPVHSAKPDGSSITDPRQASDYVWYAIERRALSYLERQKEVDASRLGAKG
jgi:hypothetical protein